jgi:glycosyltransferase involved in cell wall biosynthesis
MNPLVSVIIPTLNSQKYIRECLDSVFEQTYKNYEVIVVDGGSSDKTLEIAKEYSNVRVVNSLKGRSKQKNIGAKESNGQYLYFIDSDFVLGQKTISEAILQKDSGQKSGNLKEIC